MSKFIMPVSGVSLPLPNNALSQWPSLVFWPNLRVNSGTAIPDRKGAVADLTLVGSGTPWATPDQIALMKATTDGIYAPVANVDTAVMPAPVHGEVWILEADVTLTNTGVSNEVHTLIMMGRESLTGTGAGALVLNGIRTSDTNCRIRLGFRCSSWSAGSAVNYPAWTADGNTKFGTRYHIVGVIDLTDPAGEIIRAHLYINGEHRVSEAVDISSQRGDYLTGNFRAQGSIGVGVRRDVSTNDRFLNGTMYDKTRVYRLTSGMPDNMEDIAMQLYQNPIYPADLLRGVV